jgi:hypothetical protein
VFFIVVNALHVSGTFSTHHQELKNCTRSIGYMPGMLLQPLAVAASKLLENIIYNIIHKHTDERNLLNASQF